MRTGPSMKSKSIFVITSLSTLAVKSRRSVVEPKSISGASSSLSSFDSLRSSEPQKLPRIICQRKRNTNLSSENREKYFVLKEPHPKVFLTSLHLAVSDDGAE